MLIRAITVNYNGSQDTIECLASLRAQQGVQCCPLVVDNASVDDSVANIRRADQEVEILTTDSNLGFAGGNNVGIRHALAAGCDFLLLVNNDTILEPDCVRLLLECAQSRPDAAVITPAIYHHPERGKPWFTGSSVDLSRQMVRHLTHDLQAEHRCLPFDIPWSSGCAMLIPVPVMRLVGEFDERYFCYFEDVDWSWRARRHGYACVLCPGAVLYHKVGATAGTHTFVATYYGTRNRWLLFLNDVTMARRPRIVCRLLMASLKAILLILARHDRKTAKHLIRAHVLAIADYCRGRFGRCRYPASA